MNARQPSSVWMRAILRLGMLATVALASWFAYNVRADSAIVLAEHLNDARETFTGRPVLQQPPYLYYLPGMFKSDECLLPWPPVDWDSRLGPGGLPLLENVRIISATVSSGQRFWRVVRVKFEDITESGNDHTIYVKVIDECGNRVAGKPAHFFGEISGDLGFPAEKLPGDLCDCNFDFPMFGDAYSVLIGDQILSDIMAGMIMPMRRHVNYRITFQRTMHP